MELEDKIRSKIEELTDKMLEEKNLTTFYQKQYARQVLLDLIK